MTKVMDLTVAVAGYQVRTANGAPIGEVQGVATRGVRVHKIPGHSGHAGYLPSEAIDNIDANTDTITLKSGVDVAKVLDAPAPPDRSMDAWHMSNDWWADLLGHYGLFEPEGRGSEPFLHADQK